MKGRKPTPSKIRVLRGNPGKRPLPRNEPEPRQGIPDCPSHLSAEAKREWMRIVPELVACGLLTYADRAALAAYCQTYGRWVEAETALAKDGPVVKTALQKDKEGNVVGGGNIIQNPYLPVANKAMELMHKFLIEFGMTPSSRSRVSAQGEGRQDKLEAFLSVAQGTG